MKERIWVDQFGFLVNDRAHEVHVLEQGIMRAIDVLTGMEAWASYTDAQRIGIALKGLEKVMMAVSGGGGEGSHADEA